MNVPSLNFIDYVKSHVEIDLSLRPELKQEVVKTLLALLKIRKNKDYEINGILMIYELENRLKRKIKSQKKQDKIPDNPVFMHETKKVAFSLGKIKNEEAREIKKYLEDLLPQKQETLETYMSQELGLKTKTSYDPDEVEGQADKLMMAGLTMLNSSNIEDFSLHSQTFIPDDKISKIIADYYTKKGYVIKNESGQAFLVNKNEKDILISFSNFSSLIMVSVIDRNIFGI